MKCFKIFIKRTWQPQQMERTDFGHTNPNHELEETELGDVKPISQIPSAMTSTNQPSTISCGSGGCNSSLNRSKNTESPRSSSKMILFISIIIILIIWIIIYSLLTHYEIV